MTKYTIYCDGGGTPQVPTYFSYQLFENGKQVKMYNGESVEMHRFLCRNIPPDEIPVGCSLVDNRGFETNNISEWASAYYSVKRFKDVIGTFPVIVYQDSQLIVNQVTKKWNCEKPHLQNWLNAIWLILWNDVQFQWVERSKIVNILGH